MSPQGRLPDFVSNISNVPKESRTDPFFRDREPSPEQIAQRRRNILLGLGGVLVLLLIVAMIFLLSQTKSTGFLIWRLSNRNPNVRATAAIRLANRPQDAERIVAALGSCLQDSEESVRQAALFSLMWYSESAQALAPQFVRLLDDPSEEIRGLAYRNLRYLPKGPERLAAVKAVIASGHRKNPPFTADSELILHAIGGRNKEVYPDLVELVKDSTAQHNARRGAVYALSVMAGKEPELASDISALAHELVSTDPELAERMRSSASSSMDSESPFSDEEIETLVKNVLQNVAQ